MNRAKSFWIGSAVISAGMLLAPAAMAETPQYTPADVVKAFSPPPAATAPPAQDPDGPGWTCKAGYAPDPEQGICAPLVVGARGFDLAHPVGRAPAQAAAVRRIAVSRPAPVYHRPPVRLAAAAVTPGDLLITFRLGSSELTPQGRANAQAFAQGLNSPQLASVRFEIAGHTDSRGSAALNLALSQARADAVRSVLISDGVDPGRLVAKGYGAQQPVEGQSPDAAVNRRVEGHRVDGVS